MNVLIILSLVAIVCVLIILFLLLFRKSNDVNKNGIPDKVDVIIDVTKERVVRVKEEFQDVKSSVKNLGKQIGDVVDAGTKKTVRKGRKPKVN
jgi:uncharacterized membrane protein